ncbi:hypothetical protein [Cohnella silvisoli]|uniref:Uncharacterized protein n=1 Tax=Cohnella silvisoli TaxID=2873699 RepID=A0ABV1KZ02_9BACL|nr:hypothetical protein [Cohnella silvisoli]MCD9024304.1 hypothetical protein [Cohnella silvisoli]
MALTKKKMYAGTLATGSATLYTAPAAGAMVKEVVATNKTAVAVNVTIVIAGVSVLTGYTLDVAGTKDATVILALSTVINSGDLITGLASAGSSVDCIISGVEG